MERTDQSWTTHGESTERARREQYVEMGVGARFKASNLYGALPGLPPQQQELSSLTVYAVPDSSEHLSSLESRPEPQTFRRLSAICRRRCGPGGSCKQGRYER